MLNTKSQDHLKSSEDKEFITQFLSKMDEKLDPFGKIMLRINNEFYSHGNCSIDSQRQSDFETIVSREFTRNQLVRTVYFLAFQSWLKNGKKDNFQFAEIGAGNADFANALIDLREELKSSDNQDLKKFSECLKLNICDLEKMHAYQQEKLAEKSVEFCFYSVDLSCDQVPKFDFIFGNEIPDTQRVDFIKIKDGVGYFIGAEKSDNKIKCETPIEEGDLVRLKQLFNLSNEDGIYQIQTGNFLFFQNLNSATDAFFMSDYYCQEINSQNYLRIYSKQIPSSINSLIERNDDQIDYLKTCQEFVSHFDITYSPLVNKKLLDDFSMIFFRLAADETGQALIKFSEHGKPYSSQELKDLCTQNITREFKDSYIYFINRLEISELEDKKISALEFKKNLIIFRSQYLENPKVLKILLDKKIIDADDYDGGQKIIFQLIDQNKIDSAKLLIQHSKVLILKEFNEKNLLEYCQEKLPQQTELHDLIQQRFDEIKSSRPQSAVSASQSDTLGIASSKAILK